MIAFVRGVHEAGSPIHIDGPRSRINVRQDRCGASHGNGSHRGHGCMGDRDDLVARTDVQRTKSEMDGIRAVVHTYS